VSLSTNNNKIASGDPYVQLEVAKERTKSLEEKVFQQRREREKALTLLRRQEAELKRLEKYCSELCIELEVKKQQLKYTEDIITLHNQKNAKRNASIRFRAFLASVLFLSSSILASFGINLLTVSVSGAAAWLMISVSVILYLVATTMTTTFTAEESNL
jgi:hypothetical protein